MGISSVKSYKTKVVMSGNIVEVYEYEKEVIYGFEDKKTGRSSVADYEDKVNNRGRVLSRAKRDLRRLINVNFIKDKTKFITLTFAYNLTDIEKANYLFKQFMRRLKRHVKSNVQYVVVPEFQKRGAVHYHIVAFNMPYIKNSKLREIWGHGYVKINRIDHVDNLGAYVCKYMSKSLEDEKEDRLLGKKCYYSSRGLKKPIEVKEKDLVKNLTDSLQGHTPNYENTFVNDYNSIDYKQYNLSSLKKELENTGS